MFSMKFYLNCSCYERMRNIRRGTSKTLTKNNIGSLFRTYSHTHLQLSWKNIDYRPLPKQMQHNSIRDLSTIKSTVDAARQSTTFISKEQSRDFNAIFPNFVRELTIDESNRELPDLMDRFAKVIEYNTPSGKQHRAMILISAYKLLEDPQKLTPKNIRLANILAWCIESMQACFIILDDILDCSKTRRGAPCWYLQPKIGLSAFNDVIMYENAIYFLLKKYFGDHKAYMPLMRLFNTVVFKCALGGTPDIIVGKPKLETYTMDKFTTLAKFKTGYYTFHIPVVSAMYLAGMDDEEQHRQVASIVLELGSFYQAENDFLDYFGDSAITGKIGNDIETAKCSWLAVKALEKATPEQRKIMEEHYGRPEAESVATIGRLYEDLCLSNEYAIYKEESFNMIKTHIQQIPQGPLQDVLFNVVGHIYKKEC